MKSKLFPATPPTKQLPLTLLRGRPMATFIAILTVLFCLETAVMFLLPEIVPGRIRWIEALVDAAFLICVLAPMLWAWVVKPLRQLARAQTLLLDQTIRAQEDERRRLARDLHDQVGQSLTSLLVGLRTLEACTSAEQLHEQVGCLRQIAISVHDEVRRLARGLRPSVLDDLGLQPALERFVEDFAATHALRIDFRSDLGATQRLPEAIETTVYRIVQEACNNAVRHGQAALIKVQLTGGVHALELTIEDDGRGFEPRAVFRAGTSFGLSSMRERATLLQGTFEVRSRPGSGAAVHVCLPITVSLHEQDSRASGG